MIILKFNIDFHFSFTALNGAQISERAVKVVNSNIKVNLKSDASLGKITTESRLYMKISK